MKQIYGSITHRVRAIENLKLSYGGPSQTQASDTIQQIEALRQGCHWVWGLAHRRGIKEETIAINRDWVHNQARDSPMISMLYPALL